MSRHVTLLILLLLLPAGSARAFVCLRANGTCLRWAQQNATLKSFLGNPGTGLLNGTLSWDQNAVNAADDWNAAGSVFHFTTNVGGELVDPCGPKGPGHACPNTGPAGDNPIQFVASACGSGFGDIVAQTTNCFDAASGAMINAPVFVNRNVEWNAYDGPLQPPVNDIRRVLLHEFGHVLGLDHPDQNGQAVEAIMNSQESQIDRLQADDTAGLFSLYSSSAPPSMGCQMGSPEVAGTLWLLLAPVAVASARLWKLRSRHRLALHRRS